MIEFDQPDADSKRNVARLLDKLLEEHDQILTGKVGLTQSEVMRMTSKMKRENWKPPVSGPIAIRHFLMAGFADCCSFDYERWGLHPYTAKSWAEKQPDIVISKGTSKHGNPDTHVFNLANSAKGIHTIINEHETREIKTRRGRSCHEQRRIRKAERAGKTRRAKCEQSEPEHHSREM